MDRSNPKKRTLVTIAVLCTAMVMSIMVPIGADQASASTSICPLYSIDDVFDDPRGNWDGDEVDNGNELYNGLNPCKVDTETFCKSGNNALCDQPKLTHHYYYHNGNYMVYVLADIENNPCHRSAFTRPHDDYDGDGVNNITERVNRTDPCVYNGPRIVHRPACPHYTASQVSNQPHFDWDGDGVTNIAEWRQGTNPCVYNATVTYHAPAPTTTTVVTTTTTTTTYRLPHVARTYTPPPVVTTTSVPATICPAGYPYYHRENGQCYANPVKPKFS